MIWEKVVIEPCPIVICSDKICACVGSKGEGYCDQSEQCVTKTQILENLPRTCRVIREECLPIFLKKNQFHFTAITPRRKINRTYHACVNLGVAGRKFTPAQNSQLVVQHTHLGNALTLNPFRCRR